MSQDFLIDLSPSCTKEQAVLRLLGWGEKTITKKYITLDQSGTVQTDKKEISPAAFDLHELLHETYQEVLERFEDAMLEDPTDVDALLEEHGPRITEAEAFVECARSRLMDITDELAKPDGALRIDQEATAKIGSTCITIRSLEAWARKRYPKPGESSDQDITSENNESSGLPVDVLTDYTKGTNSLFVTLSLAVRALAAAKGSGFRTHDEPNVSRISDLLCEVAQQLSSDANRPLAGQGYDSIKKRIDQANKRLTLIPKA